MAPAEKVDKLERLMNLVAVLLDTMRPLSADELRELVGGYPEGGPTFHRAFERDKEDLREMGVPLVVQPLPGVDPPRDGYRILGTSTTCPTPGWRPTSWPRSTSRCRPSRSVARPTTRPCGSWAA